MAYSNACCLNRCSVALLGIALSGIVLTAFAALKIDTAKSNVSAVFKQLSVPVEAKFRKFQTQIDYDSAKPAASKAFVEIDVASFDLGDPEYNKEVLKKEWFDAARFPKANFVSNSITPSANNPHTQFDVTGKLTIKGKTSDVRFPLSIKKEGNSHIFEGALPIKRLAYNVGEGEWKDTSTLADEVVIKFRVTAAQ